MNGPDSILLIALIAMIATAFITLVRIAIGPKIMDRTVASDVLAVAIVGITIAVAIQTQRSDVLVLAIMFSLVGSMYSVTLGRFSERPTDKWARKSPEEIRAEELRMMLEAHSELTEESRAAIREARKAAGAERALRITAEQSEGKEDASETMREGRDD